MKNEQIYEAWKEKKGQIDTSPNFPDGVMSRISAYEQTKSKPLFDAQRFVELISARPFAKAGLIATGAVVGFVRLVIIIVMILSKGEIHG